MKKHETAFNGLWLIDFTRHNDERGYFYESYHEKKFKEIGINTRFVQDNHSKSIKNVIRGLHLQVNPGQIKLVQCTRGKIYDVVVDLRYGSSTFKKWYGVELDDECNWMLYIPEGFAHGFSVLSSVAEVEYKCSEFYQPEKEVGIRYDDAELGIDWKVKHPIVSKRDLQNKTFSEVIRELQI